jgi:hypothetical protein
MKINKNMVNTEEVINVDMAISPISLKNNGWDSRKPTR